MRAAKTVCVLMCAVLILALAGCPNPNDGTPSANSGVSGESSVPMGNFIVDVTISPEEQLELCCYADYSLFFENEPAAQYSNVTAVVQNKAFQIRNPENAPVATGTYTIVVSLYADAHKQCEIGRFEKTFEVTADTLSSVSYCFTSSDVTSCDTLVCGTWGWQDENPGNIRYVMKDTKLFLFGEGGMCGVEETGTDCLPAEIRNSTECFIGDGITSIGKNAFHNVTTLVTVSGCKDVAVIGDYAFSGCTALTTLPSFDAVTTLGELSFNQCTGLQTIDGFNNLTTFTTSSDGSRPFASCNSLIEVKGFNSVTAFPFYFAENKNLKKLSGFNAITTVDTGTFYKQGATSNTSKVKLEVIEGFNSLTSLNKDTFGLHSALRVLSGFGALTAIEDYAFVDCRTLETVSGFENVLTIGKQAFMGNFYSPHSHLTTLSGFDSVTTIDDFAFKYNDVLPELPDFPNLTTIGEGAFSNCGALTKLEGFNSVTSLGLNAFSECCGVTEIHGFNGLTELLRATFNCSATESHLKYVNGFNRITKIPENIFQSYYIETLTGFASITEIESTIIYLQLRTDMYRGFYYYGTQDSWDALTMGNDIKNRLTSGGRLHFVAPEDREEW